MSYIHKPRRRGSYILISDYIRGVTVEFEVVPGLFSYKEIDEGTKFLIEYAEIPQEGVVLDLGCGYGVIGIVLAKINPKLRVYMIDINPEAVRIAERNAKRNGVSERVIVLRSNLYEAVKDLTFDAIYSNPPLAAGMDTVEKIVTEAPNHLKPGGSLQMVVRKGSECISRLMEKAFGNVETLVSKKGYKVLKSTKAER